MPPSVHTDKGLTRPEKPTGALSHASTFPLLLEDGAVSNAYADVGQIDPNSLFSCSCSLMYIDAEHTMLYHRSLFLFKHSHPTRHRIPPATPAHTHPPPPVHYSHNGV